jgi:DNA primase
MPSRPRPDRQAAGLLALVRMDVLIWEFVLDTALGLRDFLAGEGFAPSVKTSGGNGCTFRTAR